MIDETVLFADPVWIERAELRQQVVVMGPHLFQHDGVGEAEKSQTAGSEEGEAVIDNVERWPPIG
jgi:hypothetical protein